MSLNRTQCATCHIKQGTYLCRGCSNDFCFRHLIEHRQSLDEEFQEILNKYNQFRQVLVEEKTHPEGCLLIKEVHQWRDQSIAKIEQMANECIPKIIQHKNANLQPIEQRLNQTIQSLNANNQQKEINEISLSEVEEKLQSFKDDLRKANHAIVQQQQEQSTSFISEISVFIPLGNAKRWKSDGLTVVGDFNQTHSLNQLAHPFNIYFDDDQTMYIANFDKHRTLRKRFDPTDTQVLIGRNGQGEGRDQLNFPFDIIIDQRNRSFIIADSGNKRVMRWYEGIDSGVIVAGGNGRGKLLRQFNHPAGSALDKDENLYVVDVDNHRTQRFQSDWNLTLPSTFPSAS